MAVDIFPPKSNQFINSRFINHKKDQYSLVPDDKTYKLHPDNDNKNGPSSTTHYTQPSQTIFR